MPDAITIKVSDRQITFDLYSIHLDQYVDKHHVLKIKMRGVGEVSAEAAFDDPTKFSKFLGETLALKYESDEVREVPEPVSFEFIGIVTKVSLENTWDEINVVVVTVHSPTIAMDGARRNKLFHEMKASEIINEVVQTHAITPGTIDNTETVLPYCVQYRETDYEFIMRLAGSAGLFAYYDGKEFKVTKAESGSPPSLAWGLNLRSFALGLGTVVDTFGSQVYDQSRKEVYAGETSGSLQTSLSDLPKASHDASKNIYTEASFVSGLKADSQATLDKSLDKVRESSVGSMVSCTGESYHPLVSVGQSVDIANMGDLSGRFWVQAVRHIWVVGEYHNEFVCTALESAYPSRKFQRKPVTDLQSAIVTNTEDPDNLGRVKVKLEWNDGTSAAEPEHWLRVMAPHAGMDKGFFCLPEIDDEVLIAFEHGDPDRPLVLGSLYNGVDKPPVDHDAGFNAAENDLKLFRTKSGNEIYFHDASGSETICITQPSGNTITLSADGPKITIETDGDITLKGANITLETTTGDITLKSGGAIKAESSMDTELKAGGNFKSEAGINHESKGGASISIKAPTAKIQGDAMTEIKGGLVKIN